jgi:DNA-binding GntR family transcriptional regulator
MTDTQDTDELVKEWRASTRRVEQIAADLAMKIDGGQFHRWDELPKMFVLSNEYECAQRTITSAKNLLEVHGFLTLENGRYYVA